MEALPTELITEILSRLPVKSLLCCKKVCKIWNSLINTPSFIKFHLNKALISKSDLHLIKWSKDSSLYSAEIDVDFDLYFSKLNHPIQTQDRIFVFGSCNGIVCITDSSKNDVFLYNPLTNSHCKLPADGIQFRTLYTSKKSVIFGFGYDSKNDDYKVLKICQDLKSLTCNIAMLYSLKNNTWRSVEVIKTSPVILDSNQGVLVNEALHYKMFIRKSGSYLFYKCIYRFDLQTESFSMMDTPIRDDGLWGYIMYRHSILRELDGCLSLMVNETHVVHVWVMEYGNKESWTKLFHFIDLKMIRNQCFEPIVYFKDKDRRRRFLVEISRSQLAWYDLDTKKLTQLTSHGQSKYALGFVGSLVSLN